MDLIPAEGEESADSETEGERTALSTPPRYNLRSRGPFLCVGEADAHRSALILTRYLNVARVNYFNTPNFDLGSVREAIQYGVKCRDQSPLCILLFPSMGNLLSMRWNMEEVLPLTRIRQLPDPLEYAREWLEMIMGEIAESESVYCVFTIPPDVDPEGINRMLKRKWGRSLYGHSNLTLRCPQVISELKEERVKWKRFWKRVREEWSDWISKQPEFRFLTLPQVPLLMNDYSELERMTIPLQFRNHAHQAKRLVYKGAMFIRDELIREITALAVLMVEKLENAAGHPFHPEATMRIMDSGLLESYPEQTLKVPREFPPSYNRKQNSFTIQTTEVPEEKEFFQRNYISIITDLLSMASRNNTSLEVVCKELEGRLKTVKASDKCVVKIPHIPCANPNLRLYQLSERFVLSKVKDLRGSGTPPACSSEESFRGECMNDPLLQDPRKAVPLGGQQPGPRQIQSYDLPPWALTDRRVKRGNQLEMVKKRSEKCIK